MERSDSVRAGQRDSGETETLAQTRQRIRALPKVELHLHLEGAIRPETASDLARRHEPSSPICAPGWERSFWTHHDLAGFVAELRQVNRACVRGPEDYHRVARECFEDLAAQNVLYAEVNVNARPPGRPGYVPLDEILAALDEARRQVGTRTGLRVGLLPGLNRDHGQPDAPAASDYACQIVRRVVAARERGIGVVGIDLHGDEQTFPDVSPFVSAFALAAEAGLGRRAHAGEGAGAESVWQAVRRLGVQRVAHGVRAVEDPSLVAHLAATGVALDVCPTSNVHLGVAPSVREHPIRALFEAGIPVTINSDDPLVFGARLVDELLLLHEQLGFTLAELGTLMRNAAERCFLPAGERAALARTLQDAHNSA